MEQLGNAYILNNRELARRLMQHADERPTDTQLRTHATRRFGSALFPPEPDAPIEPRAAGLERFAFGAAMWAALSA